MGIDTVVFALPGRLLVRRGWHEVFRYDGPGDSLAITAGPLGDRLVAGLHGMVGALAEQGWDVVVDHVLLDPGWVRDAAATLAPYPLLSVGVRCRCRRCCGGRPRGRTARQARRGRSFASVHAYAGYDLEVDTSQSDPDGCAALVGDALVTHRGTTRLGTRL